MLYRYKITPGSPLITPLMSDTFFGHFCWAMLYRKGEKGLSEFLDSFGQGKVAPVLFSSAFPSGYLPRPSIPKLSMDKVREFIRKHFGESKKSILEGLSEVSSWRYRQFISSDQWLELKENYSENRLYEKFMADKTSSDLTDDKFLKVEVAAAKVVNRINETGVGRGLFYKQRVWYHKEIILDLYVEINDEKLKDSVQWFMTEHLPVNGFGADKSSGMGSLSIVSDNDFDPESFSVNAPDACMSLSLTSFQGMETFDAFYHLKTKFGKLGGNFAVSGPDGGEPRPFKKPVLMYEPGAVFLCSERLNNKPLLEGVHSDTRIRHCGIPITLPFVLDR